MENDLDRKLEFDKETIRNSVRLQLPIEITTYTLPRNMEIYIRKILKLFLTECHQEHMFDPLDFCLGELLTNAKKANTKRIYFKEKNLDINDPEDYEIGMENFKIDTLENIDHYLELQKKEGLYIKLYLQFKGEKIRVDISNNSVITQTELTRIKNKMELINKYSSVAEVYQNVLDQSEGAGLGIIIIILMLRKIGLTKDNYQVLATDTETITRIVLPCNSKMFAGNEILTYEFVKLQDSVPVLSSQIEKIREIVSQPVIDRQKLINIVIHDTTLSLLLLKHTLKSDSSNINLKSILQKLNDEELREICLSSKPNYTEVENTPERDFLWNHSNKVAFYAYNFAKNYPDYQTTLSPEEAYSLGLFSNLGSLLLSNSSEEQRNYIRDLSNQFEDAEKIVDLFYLGSCNQFITMIFTKKNGFMDAFSAILGCWNNNDMYPKPIRDASCIIYLAEIMQAYKEELIEFYQIDKNILSEFNITTEEQFKFLLDKMDSEF